MMTATTRRMWIKPPRAVLVTSPSAQRTTRMIAMVINIIVFWLDLIGFCDGPTLRESYFANWLWVKIKSLTAHFTAPRDSKIWFWVLPRSLFYFLPHIGDCDP